MTWLEKIFGVDSKSKESTEIVKPKKSFKSLLNESINNLILVGHKYHSTKDVNLSSEWVSEYNKDFKFTLKIYGGSLGWELRCYVIDKEKDIKTIFRASDGKGVTDINEAIEKNESVHDDIILHVQSIIGQLQAGILIEAATLEDLISVKRNIRLWYIDADDALASYPKYKDKFKKFKGTDRYEQYNGRFIFKSDKAGIEDIMASFPDVDLAEIYDPKTETYEVFNVKNAQELFVF